jgi:hypothetical protein
MQYLLWDFDGTLAYRPGMWSGTLVEVLRHAMPACPATVDDIRPHLQAGFPWHHPAQPRTPSKTAEAWWDAELHRLQGELLLQQAIPDAPQAEACFQHALAVARRQQAKAWELRAATSLARLWQQGKRAEAHQLLAPIYGWFTEGFDTADLQEAKTLLEELGG